MAITQAQIAAAKAVQDTAAHDGHDQVRLLAGPGTGKSFSIGERVKWLIGNGIDPKAIWAVSFTNASTEDLREGILKYCVGLLGIDSVHVSTLHSLALTILAKGGKLKIYPASPRVLDEWEQRWIFDEEFASERGCGITRSQELRTHFEAKWSTGNPPLPFISSPTTPITPSEEAAFQAFYNRTTQAYCCLLPGEAVRKCIDHIGAGTLDPVGLTGMSHLVVDEYQDLNPADVQLVDLLAARGVNVFVCGDDDQSIYSFRYAYPTGIQEFLQRHGNASSHTLPTCFRCATNVLSAASSLIAQFPPTSRLPKNLHSVFSQSVPPVAGQVVARRFPDETDETSFVAESISRLITAGVAPEDVLVLISSRQVQLKTLVSALTKRGIAADVHKDVHLADPTGVRFVYAILRRLSDEEDYLALRTILGLRKGVGTGTCVSISALCGTQGLNFADQFTSNRSTHLFSKRELLALDAASNVITASAGWDANDTLATHRQEIDDLIASHLATPPQAEWTTFANALPQDITLGELLDVLSARTQRHTRALMKDVYDRLGQPVPPTLEPTGRVRVMTLHSCKGLTAKVVFIPGLEEELMPGPYRARFPGQIEEAARLLYVGITRARVLCALSYAGKRVVNGRRRAHQASRFLPSLGVVFAAGGALATAEVTQVVNDAANL